MTNLVSTSVVGDLGSGYQLPATTKQKDKELGQDDFLMLMMTQFRNQDPLKPQDPAEFLAQLAQVSSVTGIAEMNQSMATLADSIYSGQALQAASVVGRDVLAPAEHGQLAAGGTLNGAVDLPVSTASGFVRIVDASGALVRQIPLGARGAGLANFTWDGRDNLGRAAPAGTYWVVAGYDGGAGETAADTYLAKRVASVSLGGDGKRTEITTSDGQRLGLGEIRAIF
jgi:flagellar basal-body rod modification protein FlgD